MTIHIEDIIIVGAGLTGLTLAQNFKAQGRRCLLLDKSRGIGGRLATRRFSDLGLDHGAPYLSNPDPFKVFEARRVLGSSEGFYIEGGMNQLPKALAEGLEIKRQQKVRLINSDLDSWNIQTEEGLSLNCKNLIITAPLPQAIELLEVNNLFNNDHSSLKDISYKRALIYLVTLKEIPNLFSSLEFEGNKILLMRERSLHPRGLVIHFNDEFTEKYFEESEDRILQKMKELFLRSPLGSLEIEVQDIKKWRYSRALHTSEMSFVQIAPGLILTGDAFNGSLYSANNIVQVLRTLA